MYLGMVGVGGFFIMGGGLLPHTIPQFLGALSVLLAFVNVAGGFVITKRMLDMFKRLFLPPPVLSMLLTYSRSH
jgi:NAD(P) transhydrogenase